MSREKRDDDIILCFRCGNTWPLGTPLPIGGPRCCPKMNRRRVEATRLSGKPQRKPLTEQVATLTAEVERLRKLFDDVGGDEHNVLALVDLWQSEVMTARAANARHLAAIETLRAFVVGICDDSGEYNYNMWDPSVLLAARDGALAATAGYAKKADEVCSHCTERTKPFLDVAIGRWCCDVCHHPVETKDVADRDDSRPDGDG